MSAAPARRTGRLGDQHDAEPAVGRPSDATAEASRGVGGPDHSDEPSRRGNNLPGITRPAVHELRTPLTAIHGYAQLLRRGIADPTITQRAIDVILRETTRLSGLLSELSELADVEADALTFAPVDADIAKITRGVVDQAAVAAANHKLVVDGGESVAARTDPRRVAQVLAHLIDNAIKHTPGGGRITIHVERHNGAIHVAVADPGIGVDPEDAGRIYDRFYRGRNAERAGVRGLGVGLHVVSEIVVRGGGRLWHEPVESGGTVFHVSLPDADSVEP